MMNDTDVSTDYTVRKLTSDDIPMIFDLCRKNLRFYEHCPPFVTPQSIRDDMVALPPHSVWWLSWISSTIIQQSKVRSSDSL